jgi:MarR family transcriptional regulator for hemolysin
MKVEPPTLVGILDRMERDGWIARTECADDRRKKMIRPTPQAEPVWAIVVDVAMRIRARALEGLSAAQIEQFRNLLLVIEGNLATEKLTEERA